MFSSLRFVLGRLGAFVVGRQTMIFVCFSIEASASKWNFSIENLAGAVTSSSGLGRTIVECQKLTVYYQGLALILGALRLRNTQPCNRLDSARLGS